MQQEPVGSGSSSPYLIRWVVKVCYYNPVSISSENSSRFSSCIDKADFLVKSDFYAEIRTCSPLGCYATGVFATVMCAWFQAYNETREPREIRSCVDLLS